MRRRQPALSWGEAESAEVSELARAAIVEATGQRGVQIMNVELEGTVAVVYALLLEGQYAAVRLDRAFGRWTISMITDLSGHPR